MEILTHLVRERAMRLKLGERELLWDNSLGVYVVRLSALPPQYSSNIYAGDDLEAALDALGDSPYWRHPSRTASGKE
jgi:hypothetical protein